MAEPYSTRPDALHRHLPGVLALGCFAVLTMTLVSGVKRFESPASLLIVLFGAVAASVAWYGAQRERLTVTDESVTLHGWFSTTTVQFSAVGSYRFRASARRPFDFNDLWELAGRFLAFFTVRPVRWLIRRVVYGPRERGFLDGQLALQDIAGTELMMIRGSTRFVGVGEPLDRIIAAVHARGVEPFAIHVKGEGDAVGLDQISAIEIEDAELTITTARGDFEMACWDVVNVFLVLDAVLARGGTITLSSDVYVPTPLAARLGS